MTKNCIATSVHRFVEWKFPGEMAIDRVKRGIAHYNYTTSIANCSLIITITTLALTLLYHLHLVIGCLFSGLSGFIHYQSAGHLNAMNQFLTEFIESFVIQLNPLQSPPNRVLVEKTVQHAQPIRLCNPGPAWYGYIHLLD